MENNLIDTFKLIQGIPYKSRAEYPENLDLMNLPYYANCNLKRDLLEKSLNEKGYNVHHLDVIFDWKDLPGIPREILGIFRKAGTIQRHYLLEVESGNKFLKVDPTWTLQMEQLGFPVTKHWGGKVDTNQVTNGQLQYCRPGEGFRQPYVLEERLEFAEKFNQWLRDNLHD